MSESQNDNGSGGTGRPWWENEDIQQERLRGQVAIILDELDGAAVWPPGNTGEVDYLYRADRILVRDADLPRVLAVVPGVVDDALINGVSAVTVADGGTQAALEALDDALGVGVAAPDYVLYVTPAGCCPATEPDTVVSGEPDPGVRADPSCCDGAGTLVSVVDTGYIPALDNGQHAWLAGVTGDEEIFDANDIGPYVDHGTFVAGVLRCMAPRADVRVEGFLTHGGAIFESEIVKQLNDAIDDMPDIISISAGCTTRNNMVPLAFEALWEHRLKHCKGMVVVAAAGNDGSRRQFFPAACGWAVSVGAVDRSGSRAPFSNFGSWVDVYALGVDLVNAYPNGTYRYREPDRVGQVAVFANEMARWSGTSFATPLVAGMIAARMSHTGQSGRGAADSVLRIARAHARAGVGPVAEPSMACDDTPGCAG